MFKAHRLVLATAAELCYKALASFRKNQFRLE
jgi:hypothetical protein